ncbi:MAG: hypothetical protein JU82_09230 [Sulfuricurvum sp. MLSB]|jgi:hypothetical protein|uniref:VRR-NUC domain-containing protein n=1 Tax=Sulfuricurvum sp. MLSB TaxID=1537917 RepID=UPI000507590B|nr:VRR-NUC domain-containing protein [Sulfuricurvum sp. MLSB]KFN38959.1 MAG: hypothetical protein JU82_09230 [Sulfuricurvum sp. MLSB]
MNNEESRIQRTCVKWFRLTYREPDYLIFAVPNGGNRNAITGAVMKKEGVRAGINDLIIATKGIILFVEIKTEKGKQNQNQIDIMNMLRSFGYDYAVCRSFDEFREYVIKHIGISK